MNLTTLKRRLDKLEERLVCANALLTIQSYYDSEVPPAPPRCPLCGEVHGVVTIRIGVVKTREEAQRLQNGEHGAS